MSTRLDKSGVFQNLARSTPKTRLVLRDQTYLLRKNGIEFTSASPIPAWSEMTVELHTGKDGKKVRCKGVVVACQGTPQMGYSVSLVFLNLSRQSQERLNLIA